MNDQFKNNFKIHKSNIHGYGVFANKRLYQDLPIAIAIYYFLGVPHITVDFGKWINHSYKPNSKLYFDSYTGRYYLVAIRDIDHNEEITADYNDTPWFIKKAEFYYK